MTHDQAEIPRPWIDRHATSVTEKRVKGADGRLKTMRIVDLESATLSKDLTYVFRKNVEKARRDNKKLTGSPDGASVRK